MNSQVFIVNAENPNNKHFLSSLFKAFEDQDIEIYDIVTSQFSKDQAKLLKYPEIIDNSFILIGAHTTHKKAKDFVDFIHQKGQLGHAYDSFLVKHWTGRGNFLDY